MSTTNIKVHYDVFIYDIYMTPKSFFKLDRISFSAISSTISSTNSLGLDDSFSFLFNSFILLEQQQYQLLQHEL